MQNFKYNKKKIEKISLYVLYLFILFGVCLGTWMIYKHFIGSDASLFPGIFFIMVSACSGTFFYRYNGKQFDGCRLEGNSFTVLKASKEVVTYDLTDANAYLIGPWYREITISNQKLYIGNQFNDFKILHLELDNFFNGKEGSVSISTKSW
ncbi:MAG: hypothetical protein V4598_08735 [Bdellovibrionota bacterium]